MFGHGRAAGLIALQNKFSRLRRGLGYENPTSLKNKEKKFVECIEDVWSHKTPGMSKSLI